MKICCTCKQNLDFSLFGKNKSRKDGLQPNCKSCKNAGNSKYHSNNRTREKEYRRTYWQTIGKFELSKNAARTAHRKAVKLQASPSWLTEEHKTAIECKYSVAKMLSVYGNTKHAVDHIVPLQGKTVCGLHVPWNLQVITVEDNLKKGNKFHG